MSRNLLSSSSEQVTHEEEFSVYDEGIQELDELFERSLRKGRWNGCTMA